MKQQGGPAALTGEMVRAGRAIARIEQSELASAAALSLETIKRLERVRGVVNANQTTLAALRRAFETYNVHFEVDDQGRSCVYLDVPGDGRQVDRMADTALEPAQLYRAIYRSQATHETLALAPKVLDDILQAAVTVNGRLGVTGALLFANGRFLQVLEGPASAVRQVLGDIAMDRRHRDFTPVTRGEVAGRRFPNWVMCGIDAAQRPELASFDPDDLDGGAALELLSRLCMLEEAVLGAPTPVA